MEMYIFLFIRYNISPGFVLQSRSSLCERFSQALRADLMTIQNQSLLKTIIWMFCTWTLFTDELSGGCDRISVSISSFSIIIAWEISLKWRFSFISLQLGANLWSPQHRLYDLIIVWCRHLYEGLPLFTEQYKVFSHIIILSCCRPSPVFLLQFPWFLQWTISGLYFSSVFVYGLCEELHNRSLTLLTGACLLYNQHCISWLKMQIWEAMKFWAGFVSTSVSVCFRIY